MAKVKLYKPYLLTNSMRKIKVEKWKASYPKIENGKVVGQEEKEENLLIALNRLTVNARNTGLDQFRIFSRIGKNFDDAEKTGYLKLEEGDYGFLKQIIERDVPSAWGLSNKISHAINLFLDAKEEKD